MDFQTAIKSQERYHPMGLCSGHCFLMVQRLCSIELLHVIKVLKSPHFINVMLIFYFFWGELDVEWQ